MKNLNSLPVADLDINLGIATVKSFASQFHFHASADALSTGKDMATFSALNTLGDFSAQTIETKSNKKRSPEVDRILRYTTFGLMDGLVNHGWYHFIEWLLPGQDFITIAEKTACEILLYGPLWYAWYLASMTLLEKRGVDEITGVVKKR